MVKKADFAISHRQRTGFVGFKALSISEDHAYTTIYEDNITFQDVCDNSRELHVRAQCRQVDSVYLTRNRFTNVAGYWNELGVVHFVDCDDPQTLPTAQYKAMNTLLRYRYTVEDGGSKLLLSGSFIVSYLLLAPSNGKWTRIGLGTWHKDFQPQELELGDVDKKDVILAKIIRPVLPFDGCELEDICLV